MAPHSSYPTPGLVPAGFKDWKTPFPNYLPCEYTADVVLENDRQVKAGGWADPPDVSMEEIAKRPQNFGIEFRGGLPLNPLGRTGICGRGLLGKWGANCAADPIMIRLDGESWQVLVIVRKDSGQIALPGGMVDDGEDIPTALFREAAEETGTALDVIQKVLGEPGVYIGDVYEGPVDDPRNTDNAWMVTQARLFYIDGLSSNMISTKSDDPDVAGVFWHNIHDISEMYADHLKWVCDAKSMVMEVVRLGRRAAVSHRDGDVAVVPERPSRKRKSSELTMIKRNSDNDGMYEEWRTDLLNYLTRNMKDHRDNGEAAYLLRGAEAYMLTTLTGEPPGGGQRSLGSSLTNKLPHGCQACRMVATLEGVCSDLKLHIHDHSYIFSLKIALDSVPNLDTLAITSYNGRFPLGKGCQIRCHAKYDPQSKVVRVDSFDEPDLWFEVLFK